MTPLCSAVATSAPAAPLEVGERDVDLGDQRDVRPRSAAHTRQIEHDLLTPASTITRASRASAAIQRTVLAAVAADRVEVGDVQLVEPRPGAVRAPGPVDRRRRRQWRCAPAGSVRARRARRGPPRRS
jgi:hypothetical protein